MFIIFLPVYSCRKEMRSRGLSLHAAAGKIIAQRRFWDCLIFLFGYKIVCLVSLFTFWEKKRGLCHKGVTPSGRTKWNHGIAQKRKITGTGLRANDDVAFHRYAGQK